MIFLEISGVRLRGWAPTNPPTSHVTRHGTSLFVIISGKFHYVASHCRLGSELGNLVLVRTHGTKWTLY
jgi:hypothetical protein